MEPFDPIFFERLANRYQEMDIFASVRPYGTISAIYIRADPEQGVHKPPANESVSGVILVPDHNSEKENLWYRVIRVPLRIIDSLRRAAASTIKIELDDSMPIEIHCADDTGNEIQGMVDEIRELREALAQVQKQLAELSQLKGNQATAFHMVVYNITEDCAHWKELLDAHVKVVRILEVKDAQMGINLPAFEKIELEERRIRVGELQKSLQENCSDG